ncbi:hypothetical protein CW304_03935 [Bacillus sp. UFRGS-B20]|nr:hypothetical protein CW304_03935 [Bacillus sp. UFRGS-B20]
MGIITGITMEFQLWKTNWSEYSQIYGETFSDHLSQSKHSLPSSLEVLLSWEYGMSRKDKNFTKVRLPFCMWMVALWNKIRTLDYYSNGFMQKPCFGYAIRNGRAELNDFWALVTNPYAVEYVFHM